MTTQAQELQDHITSEYRSLYEVLNGADLMHIKSNA